MCTLCVKEGHSPTAEANVHSLGSRKANYFNGMMLLSDRKKS